MYVIPTLRWTWLISSSPYSRYALLTHKQFTTDTFLFIYMDYLASLTYLCWVGHLQETSWTL